MSTAFNPSAQSNSSFKGFSSINICTSVCSRGACLCRVNRNMFFMKTIFFPREKKQGIVFLTPRRNHPRYISYGRSQSQGLNYEKKKARLRVINRGKASEKMLYFLFFCLFSALDNIAVCFQSRSYFPKCERLT